MTIEFTPGLQPNDWNKPRLRLLKVPGAEITPPKAVDYQGNFKGTWGMLGNDRVGDCTAAGACHATQTLAFNGRRNVLNFTEQDALTMYSAISGYNPSDPSTDVGATLQDALNYWRKTGVGGHQIVAFAELDARDLNLVRNCIALFGAVYTGFSVSQAAMDDINANKPWNSTRRSRILGGHCVPISAYTPDSFACVTWGQLQPMSVAFYNKYFDEVWTPISLEWLDTISSLSPQGLDIATLNADFMALTGQPGPFVQPDAPTPTPTPEPQGCLTLLRSIQKQISDFLA